MILVVDASVVAMWFLPEKHSHNAAQLFSPEYELVAPDLVRLEVGSALLKAIRRKEMTVEEGHEALAMLSAAAIRLLPSVSHADAAFQIAASHGGSLYDAIYVSIARSLDAPVVTNDATLAAVAKAARVRSVLIAKGLPPPRVQ